MRSAIAWAILPFFLFPPAYAQQPACKAMPAMAGMTDAPAVPPEKLPPPVPMTGIGNGSIAITTTSPEARMWFTQGLNLLHDFWDYEASRAFEQSVRADPNCAMCFWGLYQSEDFRGENDAWADAALKRAVQLAHTATPAERLYIQAARQDNAQSRYEKAHPNKTQKPNMWTVAGKQAPHKDSKATKTLRKLVAQNPDDIQAKIFLAESLHDGFDKDHNPKPGTAETQSILAAILAQHPDDSAANHYWIHAQEPGLHPELALPSSRKLGALTPASGHMVHMPGHIFYRTGDYETARISFTDSMHTDEAYMLAQHVAVDDDWNYVHNLMYYIADLLEAGRLDEATSVSAKLSVARGMRDTTLYRFSTRDSITRLDPLLPVTLRSADWTRTIQLLDHSAPAPELTNLVALKAALLDYAHGMAALVAGDTAAAEAMSKSLDARVAAKTTAPEASAMPAMPGMSSKDAMAGPQHSFLEVASLELKAAVLLAQGKPSDADAIFTKAAAAEQSLGYHEPPWYIRPVNETRGDALLRAGRYQEAKTAYEAALAERPNSGFPLYGIAQADALAHNPAASAEFHTLLSAWQHADPNLPELAAAHAWISAHSSAGE